MTHPFAWLMWLCAAALCTWNSRNPFMLALVLLIIITVHSAYPQRNEFATPTSPYWFVPIAALLNALWTHAGDTVLMRFPETLPLIGGAITAEALAYGALNGLALSSMFVAFATMQRALPISEMIAVIPRVLHPVAVVIVIAVTYLPFAQRQARAVREAQAVRGHAIRSLRDWLPLLTPMLAGALEHAMQLAEAMSARGYGRNTHANNRTSQMVLVGGMLTVLSGWIVQTTTTYQVIGWSVTALGLTMIMIALWRQRAHAPRTSFRERKLHLADWTGIVGACIACVAVSAPIPGAETLAWTPYPSLRWPDFSPIIGILTCGLCVPALFASRTTHGAEETR